MIKISSKLNFFMNMSKVQASITRRLDAGLGGLSFSEFIILYHLSQAKDETMRRVDLAEKVGLTASGITRLLAPMEKVHLIKRQTNVNDARESLVSLAAGGHDKLDGALENAEAFASEWLPADQSKRIYELSELIESIGSKTR